MRLLSAGLLTISRRTRFAAVSAGLALAIATPVSAADRPQIFVLNTVIQGGLTVVSAAVQGKIHSRRDIVRTFVTGSGSGAGMYGAKALAGDGHTTAGWLLANGVGSISENAIAARHPLAQVGYSIGPLRIRFSIPRFDRGSDAHAHVDLSAFETFAMFLAVSENDRAGFRSGLIAFRRDSFYDDDTDGLVVLGATAGIFPGVATPVRVSHFSSQSDSIWNHETIHAIQSLQGDVLEPSFGFLTRKPLPAGERKRMVRFAGVKIGALNFANAFLFGGQDDSDYWVEIEAYRLANDRAPAPLE